MAEFHTGVQVTPTQATQYTSRFPGIATSTCLWIRRGDIEAEWIPKLDFSNRRNSMNAAVA